MLLLGVDGILVICEEFLTTLFSSSKHMFYRKGWKWRAFGPFTLELGLSIGVSEIHTLVQGCPILEVYLRCRLREIEQLIRHGIVLRYSTSKAPSVFGRDIVQAAT